MSRHQIPPEMLHMVGVDAVDAVDAVSRELPDAPTFPVAAMPQSCQRLITEAAAAIGCPPEFVALPMLATLAAAIGNSRAVKLKAGWEEGAAVYGAVIAEPGEKKTPATKVALEPAIKMQARLREAHSRAVDEYKRECREYEVEKKDAAKAGEPAPPPPQEPRMDRTLVEDVTVEALAVVLEGTPRGVVAVRDELSGWVRSMDQYKQGGRGADRQFWLSAWSNSYAAVDRKSRGEPLIITRPFVGVYGSIQPGVLHELGDKREDGLLDRFLFAYPEPVPSEWTDDEISDEGRAAYAGLYAKLRNLYMPTDEYGDPDPVRIHFSPAAKELIKRAVNELRGEMYSPGFPVRLKGPYSKLEGYMARLCLLLATARAADNEAAERIEDEDVLAAVILVDYFKRMARRVYIGLYGQDPDDRLTADVAAFLKDSGGHFKDEPSVLHKQVSSPAKPGRPDELVKRLKDIAAKTRHFSFNSGNFKKDGQSRRFVELSLENGVNGVNGVNRGKEGGAS